MHAAENLHKRAREVRITSQRGMNGYNVFEKPFHLLAESSSADISIKVSERERAIVPL
jgi:hypothetical protein